MSASLARYGYLSRYSAPKKPFETNPKLLKHIRKSELTCLDGFGRYSRARIGLETHRLTAISGLTTIVYPILHRATITALNRILISLPVVLFTLGGLSLTAQIE